MSVCEHLPPRLLYATLGAGAGTLQTNFCVASCSQLGSAKTEHWRETTRLEERDLFLLRSVPMSIVLATLPVCFFLLIGLLPVHVSITSGSLLPPAAAMLPGSGSSI